MLLKDIPGVYECFCYRTILL